MPPGRNPLLPCMDEVHIDQLSLTSFKSYEEAQFQFGKGCQVITGSNGAGKTNVLDALYYLGMCRSYFSLKDRELVRHGGDFFRLQATIRIGTNPHRLVVKVRPGESKVFEWDHKPSVTLAAHVGRLPVVLITPNDTDLLSGFSEERRRFMDQTLCQADPDYLSRLSAYGKLLQQRNAWLKAGMLRPASDTALLDVLDRQMEEPAHYIVTMRQAFVSEVEALTAVYYRRLSHDKEHPGLTYQSALTQRDWTWQMRQSRSRDLRSGRTTVGVHRDEIDLLLDGHAARRFGSQGQLKSYVMALKLAQYVYLAGKKQVSPLLLMDDIFDKLDQGRVAALMEILTGTEFGQVFITDTDANRVPGLLRSVGRPFTTFRMESSRILERSDD